MELLKTKYYPVDPSRMLIFLDPLGRERDVGDKWGRGKHVCIGLTGAHIAKHACYARYSLVPVVTQSSLIAQWRSEVGRSQDVWRASAVYVLDAISTMPASEALKYCQMQYKTFRRMAASINYERAIRDIRALIKQGEMASDHNNKLPDSATTAHISGVTQHA